MSQCDNSHDSHDSQHLTHLAPRRLYAPLGSLLVKLSGWDVVLSWLREAAAGALARESAGAGAQPAPTNSHALFSRLQRQRRCRREHLAVVWAVAEVWCTR